MMIHVARDLALERIGQLAFHFVPAGLPGLSLLGCHAGIVSRAAGEVQQVADVDAASGTLPGPAIRQGGTGRPARRFGFSIGLCYDRADALTAWALDVAPRGSFEVAFQFQESCHDGDVSFAAT